MKGSRSTHTRGLRSRPSDRRAAASVALFALAGILVCLFAASPASAAVAGDQLWGRTFDGPGHGGDTPRALALAPGGKYLYVAGTVTVEGSIRPDVCLVKYTSGGTRVWARTWGGAAGDTDRPVDVMCDAAGNVYVGGVTTKASGQDFLLIKYSPSGVRRWVRTWDGPGDDDDHLEDLAMDGDGNIYAAGAAYVAATGTDAALVKWTPAGKRAWAKTYPSDQADSFACVAVDKARKRVFAGGVDGLTGGRGWLVTRYGYGGKRYWASTVADPTTYYRATSMALTPGGAVILAGSSDDGLTTSSNGRIGRWTAAGDFVWSSGFYGTADDYDVIEDVAVDREGYVVAVGVAKQVADNYDGFLIAWRPDRSVLGQRYVGDIFNDSLRKVAVDAKRNIYVAGWYGLAVLDNQFWTMKFSPSLVPRWSKVKDLKYLDSADEPTGLVVRTGDYAGVYVTGSALNTGGWDWLTVKYKP
jgi:hypothetical protein